MESKMFLKCQFAHTVYYVSLCEKGKKDNKQVLEMLIYIHTQPIMSVHTKNEKNNNKFLKMLVCGHSLLCQFTPKRKKDNKSS